jgi:phosphatidylinositol-3-phosphatase
MKLSCLLLPSLSLSALLLAGCVSTSDDATDPLDTGNEAITSSKIKHIFVIAMENHDASQIYSSSHAPYINGTLIPKYAKASNFNDELPRLWSEPHYVWMEAGTNAFADRTFNDDSDPSSRNSTRSQSHLTGQIKLAKTGVDWMAYQEGLNSSTGACPIASSGLYGAKHDPFVFFQDIAGSPPSKTNSYCAAHHKPLTSLKGDLSSNSVKSFNFITPNLCNDMHGASGCPSGDDVRLGDDWLKAYMPELIDYCNKNAGVIFITWDEGDSTNKMPFLVVGPTVKKGYTSTKTYDHSSLLKSNEQILGLTVLSKVSSANDFSDFFAAGTYP